MNLKKGFTLIELLVVIAIIGILSSVVLASLNTARDRGADAAIKASINGVRAQAELAYDTAGCYGDGNAGCAASAFGPAACTTTADTLFAEPTIASAIEAATEQGGFNACSSSANQADYAIVVQLKSDPTKGYCIDSDGTGKEVTIASNDQAGVTAEVAAGACVE
jgi:prepilin-type N-terminal cleavage/methylation domain-containing protein